MAFFDLATAAPWVKALWIAAAFAAGYALYRLGERLWARGGHKTGRFAIGFLFVYALCVSAAVFRVQQRAERRHLQQWAERIAYPRDLEGETLFAERVAPLAEDPTVKALTEALTRSDDEEALTRSDDDPTADEASDALEASADRPTYAEAADSLTAYLKARYFTDHWRGYHFYLTLCRSDESLQIDSLTVVPCLEFFADKTGRIGEATELDGLYAMNYGVEYYSYLYRCVLTPGDPTDDPTTDPMQTVAADRPVGSPETADGLYLFVEWGRSKLSLREEAMPSAYSYAYYVDGALWSRRGHFLYDFDISGKTATGTTGETDTVQTAAATATTATAATTAESPRFIRRDGYLHCVLKPAPDQLLVLTAPALKPTALLHYDSFFLCIFFLAGLLLESLRRRTLFKPRTYAQRLQYTVFGLVACACAVLGLVSFFFIREIDRDEHTDRLKEKSVSALTALESRFMDLSPEAFPTADIGFISELAHVLSADLYLFDRNGHFLLSNRSSDERPEALCRQPFFNELQAKNSHLLIREAERTADAAHDGAPARRRPLAANGLTAYAPFRNADNEILGYVMLPYDRFGRSWETVMQRYWGAYLNLFVWLSLLTLLAAYLLSRYVTRPLKLLSRQMGALQLTEDRLSAPPPLDWHAQDEIGSLVAEYNRMTAQLSDSIRQLAEAERQSAWRQMARQVAHEIKNPLTPLQLQMQQLERAYRDRKPDFEDRLSRFGELLRTQIASLSRMADTFSQLAQWQQPQLQAVDLREAVESAAALFPAPTAFSFDLPAEPTAVCADAQWLRQILTNLLRNAVQAMEEAGTTAPHISIEADLHEADLLLHIRDNGPGIAPERQSRIFEPHFTTRSAGSGLGLAISRRLAEGMQGALTFAPAAPTSEAPAVEAPASEAPASEAPASQTTPSEAGAHFILQLPLA